MPTYTYECSACGHSLEEFQGISDPKLIKCPKCGQNKLDRLIGSGSRVTLNSKSGAPAGLPPSSCGGGCACHSS